ncbi:uncharacterized protein LOC131859441 [Cryptomeria japonica]|uniref:uncharacterized protein LOC131859441 n=1 Tax=Cryptomeria japonica TaxID=3369 RepID=UPI0027DA4DDA|nr:uncharacterized protein LOC131859441 [Cryptomeria japonica]
MSSLLYDRQKFLNLQSSETLAREESYWRQKSRDLWPFEGDRNTKFFHSSSKIKRLRNQIFYIIDSNGNSLVDEDDIASKAIRFFKSLLTAELVAVDNEFVNLIPPLVSQEDNKILMAPFSLAKLKEIVFSMHSEKASGLDGFTALFFQKCWDFIGNDVLLSKLRPWIVSLEQGGFVPSQETSEGAILAHEILHSTSQQKAPAMILKLDMLKAYDHVNRQSLVAVLAISNAMASGLWSGIKVDVLLSPQSHYLFADDMLLFGVASLREARVIKKIISDYASFFGQKAPSQVIKDIKVSLRSFLWNDNLGGRKKIPLLAWDNICCPKELGVQVFAI